MLGELSLIMVVFAVVLLFINITTNRVPKTGRDGKAAGERITATIKNSNKYADTAATMRLEKDGRKYKVKLKATESNLWLKGDSIDIIMNKDGKSYRVLFNDYFRNNESRMRAKAAELLETVSRCRIASLLTGYKKEFNRTIRQSSLDTRQIFSYVSYMKLIDRNVIAAVILTALVIMWKAVMKPRATELILPFLLIIGIMWATYSAVEACKRIMKEAEKTFHE